MSAGTGRTTRTIAANKYLVHKPNQYKILFIVTMITHTTLGNVFTYSSSQISAQQ